MHIFPPLGEKLLACNFSKLIKYIESHFHLMYSNTYMCYV
jgi:hypothetical protein